MGAQGIELVTLGGDGRKLTAERTRLEGVGNLGGGQCEAIQAGFFKFTAEEGVAATGVTSAKEQARFGLGERSESRLLVCGGVAGAIGLAVAVEFDLPVGLIDDGEVNQFARLGGFSWAVHVLGTDTVVAAGHPFSLLLFGEDE